jgi:hypothetical protein
MRSVLIVCLFAVSAMAATPKVQGDVCGPHGSGICTIQYACVPALRQPGKCGAGASTCCNLRKDNLNDQCVGGVHKLIAKAGVENLVKAYCEKKPGGQFKVMNCKSQASKRFTAIVSAAAKICSIKKYRDIFKAKPAAKPSAHPSVPAPHGQQTAQTSGPTTPAPQQVHRFAEDNDEDELDSEDEADDEADAAAEAEDEVEEEGEAEDAELSEEEAEELALLEIDVAEDSFIQRIAQKLVDRAAGISPAQSAAGCNFQWLASCRTYLTGCVVDGTDSASMQSCMDAQKPDAYKICCGCQTWNDNLFC